MRIMPWSIAVSVWSVLCAPFVEASEQPAIRQLGLCYTGFGVPGSGRPYIFDGQALVNAGEGYPTLCDISDAWNPRIVRFLPSWFFTTFLYPLPARDLVYLSSSRGPLLVVEGVKELARRGVVQEIAWNERWGRSFLAGLRSDSLGYAVSRGQIFVLDLNDPRQPRELACLSQPRLTVPSRSEEFAELADQRSNETELLSFSEDGRLSAAILDGGRKVGLLEWKTPTEPRSGGEFENVSVREGNATVYGKVLALDRQRLVLGHPASASPYWQCRRLSLYDLRDTDRPARAADIVVDPPDTHLRDLVLVGANVFAVDGRDIASGHTVHRTQRSRLLAFDASDLHQPRAVSTFDESMPTEYSRLAYRDGKLYVNDYNFGLWIFDVRDPQRPSKLGGVPVSAEGHWLYLQGRYAYLAHTFGGTIHVIDVADPAQPRRVGYYWDGQWLNYQAKIRGRKQAMYLPQYDGLAIVDLADPIHPRRVGEFQDENGRALVQPCLDVSGSWAFVSTSSPSGGDPRLLVYDVSDPLVPRVIGTERLPGKRGFRVLAAEQTIFLVAYGGGQIVAVDVSDPRRPRVMAELQASSVTIGGRSFSLAIQDAGGNGAPGVAYARGYLYVTTGKEAPKEPYVLIFDVRDRQTIRPAGTLMVPDRQGWQYFACDVLIEGNRLYLGDYGCEEVYDLTDPLMPQRQAQYRRAYSWQVGVVRGDQLLVPKLDGLEILQIPQ